MRKIIFLILSGSMLIACRKDKLEGDKALLIGDWNWVYADHLYVDATGVQVMEELTPDTEEMNYSMRFEQKGIVRYFENENQTDKYRLAFLSTTGDTLKKPGYSTFTVNLNANSDSEYQFSGYVSTDTLIVYRGFPFSSFDQKSELYLSYFVRSE